jgi:hypothetical protein
MLKLAPVARTSGASALSELNFGIFGAIEERIMALIPTRIT